VATVISYGFPKQTRTDAQFDFFHCSTCSKSIEVKPCQR
jgi:hypothetical protein